jgi:nucleoside-diphosphate-sugar epimerase
VFEHYSATRHTRVALLRLNYAIDLRYGVLTDLAQRIRSGQAVPVTMGHVNVIWQGDANRAALELLPIAASPPVIVNVSGAETLSVRSLATELGKRLDRQPRFEGIEAPDAWLSDTSFFRSTLAATEMPLDIMLDWVAEWVREERPVLGKPTRFEARDGAF